MVCRPYTPQPFNEVYYNIINTDHLDKLDDLLDKLNAEELLHSKIKSSKQYIGFKNLIYPYKTARKFEQSAIGSKFKEINLKNILNTKPNECITSIDYSLDNFILRTENHISSDIPVVSVNVSLTTAVSELLLNRIYYLQTLRGFVENYDTPDKNQEMLSYWKACAGLKE
jgi:hypothetical protein